MERRGTESRRGDGNRAATQMNALRDMVREPEAVEVEPVAASSANDNREQGSALYEYLRSAVYSTYQTTADVISLAGQYVQRAYDATIEAGRGFIERYGAARSGGELATEQ